MSVIHLMFLKTDSAIFGGAHPEFFQEESNYLDSVRGINRFFCRSLIPVVGSAWWILERGLIKCGNIMDKYRDSELRC